MTAGNGRRSRLTLTVAKNTGRQRLAGMTAIAITFERI
jgi:hypothetical protein